MLKIVVGKERCGGVRQQPASHQRSRKVRRTVHNLAELRTSLRRVAARRRNRLHEQIVVCIVRFGSRIEYSRSETYNDVPTKCFCSSQPHLDRGVGEARAVHHIDTSRFATAHYLLPTLLTVYVEIDHNFSKAHRIVTTSILPIVENYAEHSRNVWEGSKVRHMYNGPVYKQFTDISTSSGNSFSRLRRMCLSPDMKRLHWKKI